MNINYNEDMLLLEQELTMYDNNINLFQNALIEAEEFISDNIKLICEAPNNKAKQKANEGFFSKMINFLKKLLSSIWNFIKSFFRLLTKPFRLLFGSTEKNDKKMNDGFRTKKKNKGTMDVSVEEDNKISKDILGTSEFTIIDPFGLLNEYVSYLPNGSFAEDMADNLQKDSTLSRTIMSSLGNKLNLTPKTPDELLSSAKLLNTHLLDICKELRKALYFGLNKNIRGAENQDVLANFVKEATNNQMLLEPINKSAVAKYGDLYCSNRLEGYDKIKLYELHLDLENFDNSVMLNMTLAVMFMMNTLESYAELAYEDPNLGYKPTVARLLQRSSFPNDLKLTMERYMTKELVRPIKSILDAMYYGKDEIFSYVAAELKNSLGDNVKYPNINESLKKKLLGITFTSKDYDLSKDFNILMTDLSKYKVADLRYTKENIGNTLWSKMEKNKSKFEDSTVVKITEEHIQSDIDDFKKDLSDCRSLSNYLIKSFKSLMSLIVITETSFTGATVLNILNYVDTIMSCGAILILKARELMKVNEGSNKDTIEEAADILNNMSKETKKLLSVATKY